LCGLGHLPSTARNAHGTTGLTGSVENWRRDERFGQSPGQVHGCAWPSWAPPKRAPSAREADEDRDPFCPRAERLGHDAAARPWHARARPHPRREEHSGKRCRPAQARRCSRESPASPRRKVVVTRSGTCTGMGRRGCRRRRAHSIDRLERPPEASNGVASHQARGQALAQVPQDILVRSQEEVRPRAKRSSELARDRETRSA